MEEWWMRSHAALADAWFHMYKENDNKNHNIHNDDIKTVMTAPQ